MVVEPAEEPEDWTGPFDYVETDELEEEEGRPVEIYLEEQEDLSERARSARLNLAAKHELRGIDTDVSVSWEDRDVRRGAEGVRDDASKGDQESRQAVPHP